MVSAFSDSLMASGGEGGGGGWKHPLRSRKLQRVWLWYFHQMLVPTWRRKMKKFYISKSRFLERQLLSMLISRNFSPLSILTLKINPEYFRSISERLIILQNNLQNSEKSWSVKYRTAHKIRTKSRDFTKFTGACHVINI